MLLISVLTLQNVVFNELLARRAVVDLVTQRVLDLALGEFIHLLLESRCNFGVYRLHIC